jgi:hypothetical protein
MTPDDLDDHDEIYYKLIEVFKCYNVQPAASLTISSVLLVTLAKSCEITYEDFITRISSIWKICE